MEQTLQIAIDGPAGAGKSTVAKVLAKRLNCVYLDTGAMYRAMTWLAREKGVAYEDTQGVIALLENLELVFREEDGVQHLYCNGTDVTEEIRMPEISANVSVISMIPEVRSAMVIQQRAIAAKSDVVMDGRDIGTTVLPDANYKFFLTASLEERARRRYLELQAKGTSDKTLEEIMEDVARRDDLDSHREVSPLRQAPDAEVVDTSHMDQNQVIEYLIGKIARSC